MRHRVVVSLAALAIASAGCGSAAGDSGPPAAPGRAAYAAALNRAEAQLARRVAAVDGQLAPTSTPADDRRILARYERAVGATARELRAVRPPPGMAPQHQRLLAAVQRYRATLAAVRASIDPADARSVLPARRRLATSATRTRREIDAAIAAINRTLGA